MLTQERIQTADLKMAIAASQKYLLSLQDPQGYWCAELESNVTITAEVLLLHKIWGTDKTRPLDKIETYLRSQQRHYGGWELFYGDGGELSTTIEAYMGLRLLGVPPEDQALVRAQQFIVDRGGISQSRIFTKMHLALIGCYDWQGLPSLPAWIMLLSPPMPFTIYEMASWARGSTVPLMVVFDQRPVYCLDSPITLDELYVEGMDQDRYTLPRQGNWTDGFVYLDYFFKWAEKHQLVPGRRAGLRAAERWILEHQEATGDWGGIIPAMLNSLLALRCLGYESADPVVERGLEAIDNFAIESPTTYHVQPCVSPVWDTALTVQALVDSGLGSNHPALVRGGQWLLEQQILDYGDWAVKNRQGMPGAWAFEFQNRFYPDVDDTAIVCMALHALQLPNEALKQRAIARGVDWIATMQCKPGGWAAFDVDNDQAWLNALPYGDLKAMIDPNTVDVTAHVVEMMGRLQSSDSPYLAATQLTPERLERALAYIRREQEPDGSWFGRWGVNYVYGTGSALTALALVGSEENGPVLERGVAWLVGCQNLDGGWGETCRSYDDPTLKGQGVSTPSQTAWVLIGLLAAGQALDNFAVPGIEGGISYLVNSQNPDGSWDEAEFTGTGFPSHFYLRYHLYRQNFPLIALGRYQHLQQAGFL